MFFLLFVLWIIFNGRITVEIIIFGLLICGIIFAFMCRYMEHSLAKEILFMKKIPLALVYAWVLIKEIVKANVDVLKLITSFKVEAEPILVRFKTTLKTKTAKVILANSITLTPGTITVSLEKDEFLVHCMDKDFSKGLENSIFVQLLEELERDGES